MSDVVIYVRHSAGCKYEGDETARRCDCRKWLRWTHKGKRFRKAAGVRSWKDAEAKKREIEDRIEGRALPEEPKTPRLREAIDLFIEDKRVQGVTEGVLAKYRRELDRFGDHCERLGAYSVEEVSRELLTRYAATWTRYPSTQTRGAVRSRTRGFLRYCYEAQWIPRIPGLPKIQVEEPPTLPLTDEEYARLVAAVETFKPTQQAEVLALFQLMRHTGLAIRDALTLRAAAVTFDRGRGVYSIQTSRQKTGTHVAVPVPKEVGDVVQAVVRGEYVFWDGEEDIVKRWTKYIVGPAFKRAAIEKGGNMVSHRLRDTFAVSLLEKGVPMEEVSKLLGHESIKTTEKHYAKWNQGRQNRLYDLVIGTW